YEQEAWKWANWKGYTEHINRVAKVVRTKEQHCSCSCCYGTDLKTRPLHLISQRPILGHCLSGTWRLAGTFRDCEKPAKVPTQPAENQTDSRYQNASRTGHCSFAFSALASFRMGMSGSASFQ